MLDPRTLHDDERQEWRDAFLALLERQGSAGARQVLDELTHLAGLHRSGWQPSLNTPYANTIAASDQPLFAGDLAIEERLASIMRWNALAMVVRANKSHGELGGHIASYASAADLFEVGFNHFFHARNATHGGDLVFFQPHSAPGVYARAFLEGRLTETDLAHYRQELTAQTQGAQGLSSYPHPWLMPHFWQFPTGSMGIGPISSIYQARFMRYLEHRGLLDCRGRTVWGIFGDGEMDEPESMSALTLAARERLDNLVWVVNCNLQRLDGPVRGNGRIIDELERLFAGAGWRVIKLIWGSDWDGLFARDQSGALLQAFAQTVDGQMQTFAAKDGRYNRDNFFGQNSALTQLAMGLTDDQIDRLKRGGHDLTKIYAAYAAALQPNGQPVVILAHTKKGYGMGKAGQGKMTTHSQKKLDDAELLAFRNRFNLPLSDAQTLELAFYRPPEDSAELQYLKARRAALGGAMPARHTACDSPARPPLAQYAQFAIDAQDKVMSTTMAFVRMLGQLLKAPELGPRLVPIVADEARTFGMANLFKQVGIYSSIGQHYDPEDIGSVLSYREATDGQILEEGISEAGAMASWTAAATSYSVHGLTMLPFYIYYSMFGFQRIGDLAWAAGDMQARGFLLGGTSGRTTLNGEGLQHEDGHSHLFSGTIPNCVSYDPSFAHEVAVIIQHGLKRMVEQQENVFYYLTLLNENYAMPGLQPGTEEAIIKGMYLLQPGGKGKQRVQLLGSGSILRESLAAQQLLADDWKIAADVWSCPSFTELAHDGQAAERWNLLHPLEQPQVPFVAQQLAKSAGPVVAATDYVRAYPEQIRAYLPKGRGYRVLGTDGFGRSDFRAALRCHFEVNRYYIVLAALRSLADEGTIEVDRVAQAIARYNIDQEKIYPLYA